MGMPTWRVVLIGAVMGLVAVGVVVALVFAGVLGPGTGSKAADTGQVMLALVMTDESGTVVPRVIDVYSSTATGTEVRSVNPTTTAALTGTSAKSLGDVYAFGGGKALAAAVVRPGEAPPTWVVVDASRSPSAASSQTVTVHVPQQIDVYVGGLLHTFAQGDVVVALSELPALFDGVAYLPEDDAMRIREQVGDQLIAMIASPGSGLSEVTSSELTAEKFAAWLKTLTAVRRASGT